MFFAKSLKIVLWSLMNWIVLFQIRLPIPSSSTSWRSSSCTITSSLSVFPLRWSSSSLVKLSLSTLWVFCLLFLTWIIAFILFIYFISRQEIKDTYRYNHDKRGYPKRINKFCREVLHIGWCTQRRLWTNIPREIIIE